MGNKIITQKLMNCLKIVLLIALVTPLARATTLAPGTCFEGSHWVYYNSGSTTTPEGKSGNCIDDYVHHCLKYDVWTGQCSQCSAWYHHAVQEGRNECHLNGWAWAFWILLALTLLCLILGVIGWNKNAKKLKAAQAAQSHHTPGL